MSAAEAGSEATAAVAIAIAMDDLLRYALMALAPVAPGNFSIGLDGKWHGSLCLPRRIQPILAFAARVLLWCNNANAMKIHGFLNCPIL
jgi:hypothetical protein